MKSNAKKTNLQRTSNPTVAVEPPVADTDGEGITSLQAKADRHYGRAGTRSRRHVLIQVSARSAPQVGSVGRGPVQIGFAVDRSGSMSGDKLEMAKRALADALQQLLIKDSFTVVWFDNSVLAMEPCQRATAQAVAQTIAACQQVQTGGSTALQAGWDTAAQLVYAQREPNALARVLLLTDGEANVGPGTSRELGPQAAAWHAKGISTSAIGIGEGYNEELLNAMATQGGGSQYYAASAQDLPGIVARELGEVKEVVARGAVLAVRPSAGVRVEVLSGFGSKWTGTDLLVNLGDLVADQEVLLVLELTLPAGRVGETCGVECSALVGGEPALVPAQLVQFTLADHPTNDAQSRNLDVDQVVARQYAARARMRAVQFNRQGHYGEAGAELSQTAARIATYMGNDPELRKLVADLTQDAQNMAVMQSEFMRKQMYTDSNYIGRSKRIDGSSRRTTDG